jgi:hypothetical protein
MTHRIAVIAIAIAGLLSQTTKAANSSPAPQLSKAQSDFFEGKVRPLLAERCYQCHSADAQKVRANLLLDTREGVLKGGDTGAAIVPGHAERSLLIKAIGYKDPDLQMPPKGDKLGTADIATLTQWINMGAPDPRTGAPVKLTGLTDKARAHWAYQTIQRPSVPNVKDQSWVKTPVDAFILATLEKNGMKPSPPASKETLIRRATYDLIGLPPTPQEVQAFVDDTSPNAYEKVIDRLLASPHYGERWGRYWLDSARYSDTSGAEKIKKDDYRYAFAWTYRDYVIKAFNDDEPYNKFLMEQIAADQMASTRQDVSKLAALGYLTVGKKFDNPNDQIDERIDALTKSTMALTVACARCHDHKFDPIPQADYYSLHGILASTYEPDDKPQIGKPADGADYQDYLVKLHALEQKNRDKYYEIIADKSGEFRKHAAAYLEVALLGRRVSEKGDVDRRGKLIDDNHLDQDLYTTLRIGQQPYIFMPLLRFSQLDPSEYGQQSRNLLSQIASGYINNRPINPIVAAMFRRVSPNDLHNISDVCKLYGELFSQSDSSARSYLAACRTATTNDVTGFDAAVASLAQFPSPIEPAPRLDTERLKNVLSTLPFRNNRAYQQFAFNQINELELTHPGAPPHAMIVADVQNPHDSPIFIRGEATNKGEVVPRRFLAVASGPYRQPYRYGSGRLQLAQDITSANNPLTPRAAVNRIWMHHFGQGFVRTPDDLGVQSEPPSHPELIDYLARRFMESGWSFKAMHKMIMLSNAYQESSETNAEYAQKDPENRLIWRANLRRLDFEAVRDSMLQLTGKIDLTMYGKPVNLTDEPYSNRRSVYGYVDRGDVPELMQQFDFSDPDRTNSSRTSTIVPQQALFFMNSPMSADVARKVTTRAEFTAAADDAARVKAIYNFMFQRNPRPEEVSYALSFIAEQSDSDGDYTENRLNSNFDRRNNVMKQKMGNKRGGLRAPIQNQGKFVDRKPLTTWELYAQALLFTNEMVYVN